MPHQAVVFGEPRARVPGQRELGAAGPVERVADGGEHGQPVDAAFEEDVDDDRLRPAVRRVGDAGLQRVEPTQPAGGVHREPEPRGPQEEAPPVHPRARGERHAGLDRGQPATRLGRRGVQQFTALEVLAGAVGHQLVW
ncbi:hypothetical protein LRS13_22955 [Svornostia abyssi]|uniref:Uncharacterized protein n=1 Tax=Svornostia abyssi TaxID=2898438 RepID=A0ABY5PFP2_9ACTN|nr:hypothetical protein LRS13_22955 [Parviterribacteraceae bacterium J379]